MSAVTQAAYSAGSLEVYPKRTGGRSLDPASEFTAPLRLCDRPPLAHLAPKAALPLSTPGRP